MKLVTNISLTNIKHKNLILSMVFSLSTALIGLKAQETTSTSGTDASGSGGLMSYTVGQIICNTHSDSTGSVTQGVQQPYEISVINAIVAVKGIGLNYMVYPNPTTSFLILKIKNYNVDNLTCQLYDINGKLLVNEKLTKNETTIAMKDFSCSIYFLIVKDNAKEVKIFKIIKN